MSRNRSRPLIAEPPCTGPGPLILNFFTHLVLFRRPFSRFGVIPFGGRSTAIKLRDGGVWVLASTPLEAETKAKIDELGPVK